MHSPGVREEQALKDKAGEGRKRKRK